MKWKVSYYDESVMKGLLKWPKGIKSKYLRIVDLLEEHGPKDVGMPFVKAMGDGLFEIRAKGHEGIGRAFFVWLLIRR